jgi:hypothetical protein
MHIAGGIVLAYVFLCWVLPLLFWVLAFVLSIVSELLSAPAKVWGALLVVTAPVLLPVAWLVLR